MSYLVKMWYLFLYKKGGRRNGWHLEFSLLKMFKIFILLPDDKLGMFKIIIHDIIIT